MQSTQICSIYGFSVRNCNCALGYMGTWTHRVCVVRIRLWSEHTSSCVLSQSLEIPTSSAHETRHQGCSDRPRGRGPAPADAEDTHTHSLFWKQAWARQLVSGCHGALTAHRGLAEGRSLGFRPSTSMPFQCPSLRPNHNRPVLMHAWRLLCSSWLWLVFLVWVIT